MSVRELKQRPDSMDNFPDDGRYRWLELHNCGEVYGLAALAEMDDMVEGHLTILRWGGKTLRHLRKDLLWLKEEARRLGKSKVMAVRADADGQFDPRLFKFLRLFGFTDMCVLQTATLAVDP